MSKCIHVYSIMSTYIGSYVLSFTYLTTNKTVFTVLISSALFKSRFVTGCLIFSILS